MSDAPLIYVDLVQTVNKGTKSGRPQRWRWTARNGGNEKILAKSSENYTNREDAIAAITELFGTGSNVYRRETEHGNQLLRLAQDSQNG